MVQREGVAAARSEMCVCVCVCMYLLRYYEVNVQQSSVGMSITEL